MKLRKCYVCKNILELENFYSDKSKSEGKSYKCKKCFNGDNESRRKKNNFYKRRYKKISKKPISFYQRYKSSSTQRKKEFSLSKEEFMSLWQKNCYYCGDKIAFIGIDRIDNKKGYIINNVVPCCFTCNKMKSIMSEDEFIKHCIKIIKFHH